MFEAGDGLRFGLEAADEVGVVGILAADDLNATSRMTAGCRAR
jgi:hypothetical protein